jgi:hypothetical protein
MVSAMISIASLNYKSTFQKWSIKKLDGTITL